MKIRQYSFLSFALLVVGAVSALSQPFIRQIESIPVAIGGVPVVQPFAGGINTPNHEFVDIDGDGDLDLFVFDNDLTVDFYRNTGTPSVPDFRLQPGAINLPPFLKWYLFVDLNGDGTLDVVSDDSSIGVRYYQNVGTRQEPNFVLQISHMMDSSGNPILGSSIGVPAIVDLNGDSLLDLLSSNIANGALNYYQNVGTKSSPLYKFITDHLDDIIVLGDTCLVGPHAMPVNTDGDAPMHGGAAIRFADLYNKGTQDLYYGDLFSHGIFRMENIGTPTQPHLQCTTNRYPPESVVLTFGFNQSSFADIDDDGDLDMFVGVLNDMQRHSFWHFENIGTPGSPSFELLTKEFLSMIDVGENASPALVDIDGDGRLDLIIGTLNGELWYFSNDGSPTAPSFVLADTLFGRIAGNFTYAPAFVDIDGDGDKDLFLGQFSGRIKYYQNVGTSLAPQFVAASSPVDTINVQLNSVPAFVDIDGDGDLDLFVGKANGSISFYQNVGDSTSFQPSLVTKNFDGITVGQNARPTFVDVDRDGDYDLCIGNAIGSILFYENTGTRTTPQFVFRTGHYGNTDPMGESAPSFGDIDGDGDPDLFVGTRKGGLQFYRNDVITDVVPVPDLPLVYELSQNFPNPFNPSTTISFRLIHPSVVSLTIYNLFGQEIARPVDGRISSGEHVIRWNAVDFPSGVYYYRIVTDRFVATRKMILLK